MRADCMIVFLLFITLKLMLLRIEGHCFIVRMRSFVSPGGTWSLFTCLTTGGGNGLFQLNIAWLGLISMVLLVNYITPHEPAACI